MSNDQLPLIKRITQQAPIAYSLIALFHVCLLLFYLYRYIPEEMGYIWLQPLWIVGYATFWLFCCLMKKWAAYGYLFLTVLNIALRFIIKDQHIVDLALDALFPADVLFSFLLLFHFRRFN